MARLVFLGARMADLESESWYDVRLGPLRAWLLLPLGLMLTGFAVAQTGLISNLDSIVIYLACVAGTLAAIMARPRS